MKQQKLKSKKFIQNGATVITTNYRITDLVLLLVVTVTICSLATTEDSFWIDEGWSAWIVSLSSVGTLVQDTMLNCRDAIAQMPFYNFYIWFWARLFGMSEVALRLSNAPLVLVLFLSIQIGSIKLFGRRFGWMIIAVSPFLWFYMNEVRPYVAVMAFAGVATVSLLLYLDKPGLNRRCAPWFCLFSSFLLCGFHMLGIFLIPTFITGLTLTNGLSREKWEKFFRDWCWPFIVFLPLFIILGSYFAWTLLVDAHGVRGIPGLKNIAFAWYEFAGFLGLGPPRNVLREAPVESAYQYFWFLLMGVAGWFIVIIYPFIRLKNDDISKRILLLYMMFAAGVLISGIAALIGKHNFWGRHVAEFFPLFILILIGYLAGDSTRGGRSRYGRMATICITVIWLFSAVRLGFLEEYKKDDFRGAVSCVIKAAGETGTILWTASIPAASYYGLQFDIDTEQIRNPSARLAVSTSNWRAEQLEEVFNDSTGPVIVALSRPDWFDRRDTVQNWIKMKNGTLIAELNAFKIYEIPKE